MSLGNFYYYDKEKCDFIQVEYSLFERVIYNVCLWLLCGIVLSGVGIIVFSSVAGSPAELALKAENKKLVEIIKKSNRRIAELDYDLKEIAEKDNEVYRSVLGMTNISMDERMAGAGGSENYLEDEYTVYNEVTKDVLKKTFLNLENLEKRLEIQKTSLEEIKSYYNFNKEKMKHMPFIKPVNSIITSMFGNRYHPVYKKYIYHWGIDFRAKIGTPVYATGDGDIKVAGTMPGFGKAVYINHGYGYQTRYAHLSRFAPNIKRGGKVKRGQLIGYSGNTGITSAPHLHYEIRLNGEPIDPLQYLFEDLNPETYLTNN